MSASEPNLLDYSLIFRQAVSSMRSAQRLFWAEKDRLRKMHYLDLAKPGELRVDAMLRKLEAIPGGEGKEQLLRQACTTMRNAQLLYFGEREKHRKAQLLGVCKAAERRVDQLIADMEGLQFDE